MSNLCDLIVCYVGFIVGLIIFVYCLIHTGWSFTTICMLVSMVAVLISANVSLAKFTKGE